MLLLLLLITPITSNFSTMHLKFCLEDNFNKTVSIWHSWHIFVCLSSVHVHTGCTCTHCYLVMCVTRSHLHHCVHPSSFRYNPDPRLNTSFLFWHFDDRKRKLCQGGGGGIWSQSETLCITKVCHVEFFLGICLQCVSIVFAFTCVYTRASTERNIRHGTCFCELIKKKTVDATFVVRYHGYHGYYCYVLRFSVIMVIGNEYCTLILEWYMYTLSKEY